MADKSTSAPEQEITEQVDNRQLPDIPKPEGDTGKKDLKPVKPRKKKSGNDGPGGGKTAPEYPPPSIIAFCDESSMELGEYAGKKWNEIENDVISNNDVGNQFNDDLREALGMKGSNHSPEYYYKEYLKNIDETVDDHFSSGLSNRERDELLKYLLKNAYRENIDERYNEVLDAQKNNAGLRKQRDGYILDGKYEAQPATKDELYALIQFIDESINNHIYVLERSKDAVAIAANQVQDSRLQAIEYKIENDGESFGEFLIALALQFGVVGGLVNSAKWLIGRMWSSRNQITALANNVRLRTGIDQSPFNVPAYYSGDTNNLISDVHTTLDFARQVARSMDNERTWITLTNQALDAVENTGLNLIKGLDDKNIVSQGNDGPCAAVCREMNSSITTKIHMLREQNLVLKNYFMRIIHEYDNIAPESRILRNTICEIRKELAFHIPVAQLEAELEVFERTTELYIWYKYITRNQPLLSAPLQKKLDEAKENENKAIQAIKDQYENDLEAILQSQSPEVTNPYVQAQETILDSYLPQKGFFENQARNTLKELVKGLNENLLTYIAKRFNRYFTKYMPPEYVDTGTKGRVTPEEVIFLKEVSEEALTELFMDMEKAKDFVKAQVLKKHMPSKGYVNYRMVLPESQK